MTKDGVSTTYTYNLANQLLTEVSQGVTKTYTYNNAGNLTTVKNGSTTLNTYTYDAWGRQTGYTAPQDLITATYTYGPDDLRRSKTVGSTTTEFVWSNGNMVYESVDSSGTVYRYGATLFASDDGTATYLFLLNGHGDVTQMLAGTTVVKRYTYDAFGNEIGINTADTNPFRYCAQYFDKESGTIYLRARYYAPGLGRFTQQDGWAYADTSEPRSLNLYVYCWNDPVTLCDPSGHDAIHWLTAAAIVVLAGAAVVATAGGATPALMAIGAAVQGTAIAATSTTLTACVFVGASTALVENVVDASMATTSLQEFIDYSDWGTVTDVALGGAFGYFDGHQYNTNVLGLANDNSQHTIENTQKQLQEIANEIKFQKTGHVSGSHQHKAFSDKIKSLRIPGLESEVSYSRGVPQNGKGSVRADVILSNGGKIIAIFDLKTGSAKLTPKRVNQLQKNISDVPVIQIKPQ